MRQALVQFVLGCAKALGLFSASRWLTRRQLRILCYHGIWLGGKPHYGDCLFMDADRFRRRIDLLRRLGYPVLPLDDAVRALKSGKLPNGGVAITIDDAWYGTYAHMLPVLRQYDFPATLYVTTYYALAQRPVLTVLIGYIVANRQPLPSMSALFAGERAGKDDDERPATAAAIAERIDRLPTLDERWQLLKRIADRLAFDLDTVTADRRFDLMNAAELRHANADGFDIQLHTHTHRMFGYEAEGVARDIGRNRDALARITGRAPDHFVHFCYPSGQYDPAVFDVLRDLGIRSATTTEFGLNGTDADAMKLARILDCERMTDLEFEAKLCGFWSLASRALGKGSKAKPVRGGAATRRYACVFLAPLLMLLQGESADAAVERPISDGPGGVTCRHFASAGSFAWKRPLGDWVDAKGQVYGLVAFGSAPVRGGNDRLQLDVTALVRAWADGTRRNTGILLRAVEGNGAAAFHSRESDDEDAAPALEIEWRDGTRTVTAPTADTTLDCSTHRSLGNRPVLRIGAEQATLLAFNPSSNPGDAVVRAVLRLSVQRRYTGELAIGAFAPTPPWAEVVTTRNDGIAIRYHDDRAIENDPDVLFVARFDQPEWRAAWNRLSAEGIEAVVDEDPSNGFVPFDGRALKTTLRKGANTALNLAHRFARDDGGEPEEAFFRYYLRFGRDWNPDLSGGKLPGLAGTYGKGGWGTRKADGFNGWSARGSFNKRPRATDATGTLTSIGSYVYHAGMKANTGSHFAWSRGPGALLENEQWYSVEQQVKLNTPGRTDGELRAWVDGVLVFERTNLRFRETDALRIESVWLNVYHGGMTPAPREMSIYIDNVVVARKYIGPRAR